MAILLLLELAGIVLVFFVLDFRIRKSIEWFSVNYYETPDTLHAVFAREEIARTYESFKRAEIDYKTERDKMLPLKEIRIEQEKIAALRLARGMYEFKKFRYRAKMEANISALNGKRIEEAERGYLFEIGEYDKGEFAQMIESVKDEDYCEFEYKNPIREDDVVIL